MEHSACCEKAVVLGCRSSLQAGIFLHESSEQSLKIIKVDAQRSRRTVNLDIACLDWIERGNA
jgi:hypothetical protein